MSTAQDENTTDWDGSPVSMYQPPDAHKYISGQGGTGGLGDSGHCKLPQPDFMDFICDVVWLVGIGAAVVVAVAAFLYAIYWVSTFFN